MPAERGPSGTGGTKGELVDFEIGDVVRGRFASRREITESVIVRGRVDGQWHGDCISYTPGFGYGAWGYDSDVAEVLRRATAEDLIVCAVNYLAVVNRD